MEQREEAKRNALELLRSIQSLDDLKEQKDEVLNLIDDIFKYGIQSLKDFFKGSLSSEAEQEEIAKFQDEEYFFDKEIEKELDRIADLPGIEEFFETFKKELEGRIQPHLEEFAMEMAKSMGDLMGDMMGGFGEIFGDIAQEPEEIDLEDDLKRSNELYLLYEVKSKEDLNLYKDDIIETVEEQLKFDLGELQDIKAVEFPLEEVQDRLKEIHNRKSLMESELDVEFKRIGSISDIGEYSISVKEEITSRMDPISKEIDELLGELTKTV
jgi:hypothetical protein